ncbi:MAG TPA: NAD(P)/FAD-dependent oxidoreductase [Treponemataceae bacterium]|nr:NAD(P)/FAD-dependent oxidoreductase [Treponemataceae bacterium]HPS43229.1 NAD(P)/FAD-dependent oxidoreductase [Treponemataceae bacterium]
MVYDALIIGKGPAGISAAIYLARAGYAALACGKDGGALERAEKIENYYGFPQAVSGPELVSFGINQAERVGVAVHTSEIVGISMEDTFVVKSTEGELRARTVLIATGKSRAALAVPGFEEFRGKGISFCATCDGFFYRKKRLAVIGAGDYAAAELAELLPFTNAITLFTNGAAVTSSHFPEEVARVASPIARFAGADRLSAIVTADGAEHPLDGAFVAIGTAGAADFAAKIGVAVEGEDIVVDRDFMTNLPGLFAAGDCIGGFYQVAKAVSDGALAAKAMIAFLKKTKKPSQ